MSAKTTYEERIQASQSEAERVHQKARWFPWLRAGFFLFGVLLSIRIWAGELASSWLWLALASFVAFIIAAVKHQALQKQKEDAELLHRVNQRALQRYQDEWQSFSRTGQEFDTPEHPYGHDLDLFGQGSLFQMIQSTTTWFGYNTLGQWLLHRADLPEIKRRQALVKDLADRLELRQGIEREGLRIGTDPEKADPESFLRWVEAPAQIVHNTLLQWSARLLPAWVVLTMGYWMYKVLPPWLAGVKNLASFAPYSALYWLIPWAVLVVLFARYVGTCQDIFRQVIFHERAFSLYRALFERIDQESAEGTPLGEVQKRLRSQGWAPHEAMKRLQWYIDLAEVRQSPIVHLPLNLLFLWDIHCLFGMERWKHQLQGSVRTWFKEVGELEALSSFAGLAYDHPECIFPEVLEDTDENTSIFTAVQLGHPLLPASSRVANDITLDAEHPIMLVTGSNMSGKSTMLRSIGLNAVLAYAGSVVCAESLQLSSMQIGTSMRISDSLEHGISYFMAELKRIHRIVSLKDEDAPLLFLLDEILHGTNTRERRIAALSIISLLQQADAIGCVTTHDLELAEGCKQFGEQIQFTYFTDLIQNDTMAFDYILQQGICPTTNALKLMKIVGIPLPTDIEL